MCKHKWAKTEHLDPREQSSCVDHVNGIPAFPLTYAASMPGTERIFCLWNSKPHAPPWKGATPLWEDSRTPRPAHLLVAVSATVSGTVSAPRPRAERSSGIGPSLGEFQNDFSDHEASNARRFFYHSECPCPRICSTAGAGSPTTQYSCHLQPLHSSPNLSNLGFLPHSQILSQILPPWWFPEYVVVVSRAN